MYRKSRSNYGVYGESTTYYGVYRKASLYGTYGEASDYTVYGRATANNGDGVMGTLYNLSAPTSNAQ